MSRYHIVDLMHNPRQRGGTNGLRLSSPVHSPESKQRHAAECSAPILLPLFSWSTRSLGRVGRGPVSITAFALPFCVQVWTQDRPHFLITPYLYGIAFLSPGFLFGRLRFIADFCCVRGHLFISSGKNPPAAAAPRP